MSNDDRTRPRRGPAIAGVGAVAALLSVSSALAAPGAGTSPSSSGSPYVVRSQPGVVTKSILTVGDSVNLKPDGVTPYRMVGIPDGLGAFDNGDGTFTVLMNHELRDTAGVTRAHGAAGAFVSSWVVRKDDLSVISGQDLIQDVATWDPATSSYNEATSGIVISRLCSADLPDATAFWNAASGLGYNGRLFMDGEEVSGGRAFAHSLAGTSWELPRLGKFAWENAVASPSSGNKTVVIGLDDTTPGEVYVYVGDKTSSGTPVDEAGLTNGSLYGIKVAAHPDESIADGVPNGTAFSLLGRTRTSSTSSRRRPSPRRAACGG